MFINILINRTKYTGHIMTKKKATSRSLINYDKPIFIGDNFSLKRSLFNINPNNNKPRLVAVDLIQSKESIWQEYGTWNGTNLNEENE